MHESHPTVPASVLRCLTDLGHVPILGSLTMAGDCGTLIDQVSLCDFYGPFCATLLSV